MKNLVFIITLISTMSLLPQKNYKIDNPSIDSLIFQIINATSIDTLEYYVNALSGEDSITINNSHYLLNSRYSFHPHNDIAADFIYQALQRTGLPTFNQYCSETGRNIYCVQNGTIYPDIKFILCAHYDDMPLSGYAPGADDNASGTAAVLEAARIISKIPTPYTIVYALWDEEETGYCGSSYFAQQEYFSGQNIGGVINTDMIGWDSNNDGIFEIHTRNIANSETLAAKIAYLGNLYQLGIPVIQNPGTSYSDHQQFWERGYTAVLLIESFYGGDFNDNYHTSEDKIAQFNLNYFYSMSKLAIGSIAFLGLNNIIVNTQDEPPGVISYVKLEQNYPNPYNMSTTFSYSISRQSKVLIQIFDLLGNKIETLVNEEKSLGTYYLDWNASNFPSGIYYYQIITDSIIETKKMILLK